MGRSKGGRKAAFGRAENSYAVAGHNSHVLILTNLQPFIHNPYIIYKLKQGLDSVEMAPLSRPCCKLPMLSYWSLPLCMSTFIPGKLLG